jgi:hypothetical protein
MPVEVLIDENDTINAVVVAEDVSVEIVANVTRKADTIYLQGLHLERLTDCTLNRGRIALLCAEVCRHYGVEKLIVQGARRTTGRMAGTIAKPIHYTVRK